MDLKALFHKRMCRWRNPQILNKKVLEQKIRNHPKRFQGRNRNLIWKQKS